MKGFSKRLSQHSLKRRSTGSSAASLGAAAASDVEMMQGYDKCLTKLAKGLEKALVKLEDKQDIAEVAAAVGGDLPASLAELSDALAALAAFHTQHKNLSHSLREELDRGSVSPLNELHKGTLKEALAAMSAHSKANEAYLRDEKVHETRHTPETKAKVDASQATVNEKGKALIDVLERALPEARTVVWSVLQNYASAYGSFFSTGQQETARLAAAFQRASPGVGGVYSSSSSSSSSSGGVFGAPLSSLCELEAVNIPKFVEAAIALLESRALNERNLFRADSVPEAAYGALRQQVESGSFSMQGANVLAVGAALHAYALELPEPVCTFELYEQWVKAIDAEETSDRQASLKALLEQLPTCNAAFLGRACGLLARLAREKLSASRLAALWSGALLRPKEVSLDRAAEEAAVASMVVVELIHHHAMLWQDAPTAPKKVAAPKATPKPVLPPKKAEAAAEPTAAPAVPAKHPLARGRGQRPHSLGPKATAPRPKKMPPRKGLAKKKPLPKGPPPKGKSTRVNAPPPARVSPRKPVKKEREDSFEDLDSEEEDASSGGLSSEEDTGSGMRHATSARDAEDMQSLGILGMMLSDDKKASLSPSEGRKSAAW